LKSKWYLSGGVKGKLFSKKRIKINLPRIKLRKRRNMMFGNDSITIVKCDNGFVLEWSTPSRTSIMTYPPPKDSGKEIYDNLEDVFKRVGELL